MEHNPAQSTRYRDMGRIINIIFVIFAIAGIGLSVFFVFGMNIFGHTLINVSYRFLLITVFLPFAFLIFPARSGKAGRRIPWYDYVAGTLSFLIPLYFFFHGWEVVFLGWPEKEWGFDLFLSLILCVLVLDIGRRTGGFAYFLVCIACIIYPLTADWYPGIVHGRPIGPVDLIANFNFGSEVGFVGLPTAVMGNILIGFLIFAAAMLASGAGTFFLNLAFAVFGKVRGGPAKVAVVGSGLMGSMSGSALANVVTTGSITIPAMKRIGYPAVYAGAIEACASTGGIFMPPVMGSVAFIMVEFLGISYSEVIVAAAIPATLYYLSLIIQVDAYAARVGLKGLPEEELPSVRETLKEGWHFIFAFAFLVWGLMYMRWEALTPYYATVVMIILSWFKKDVRIGPRRMIELIDRIGRLLTETLAVLLPIGFVLTGVVNTGMAPAFATGIVYLGGQNAYLVLFLGVMACYLMGMMGMISPAYIFLAVSMAPALEKIGFDTLAIHLFIIYYAMLACITLPVAIAAFVAGNIAGASPMQTAWRAMRLGVVIYILPFFFVLNPALILHGAPLEVILSVITAIVGVFLIASGVESYMLGLGRVSPGIKYFVLLAGILMAAPEKMTDVYGVGLGAILVITQVFINRFKSSRINP